MKNRTYGNFGPLFFGVFFLAGFYGLAENASVEKFGVLRRNAEVTDSSLKAAFKERVTRSAPEQRFFDWTGLQFPKETHRARRQKMMRLLKESGGGIYLAPSRGGLSQGLTFRQLNDFLYFTGLELPDSMLALDADAERTILFVPARDARFENPARPNEFPGRPLGDDPMLAEVLGIADMRLFDALEKAVSAWVKEGRTLWLNTGRPGRLEEHRDFTVETLATDFIYSWNPTQALLFHLQQAYPESKIRNAYGKIARLRMVKSPEEIAVIRRVCTVNAQGIREAAKFIRDGVYERTLQAEMEATLKRGGVQRLPGNPVIRSGPNSLWPWRILAAHYDRRNRQMKNGELVIFDVTCERDYYVSDAGRTFPVSGRFTEEQKRILQMVTDIADAFIAAMRPGLTFSEVKQAVISKIPPEERKHMPSEALLEFGPGHHIGLEARDPYLGDVPLEPGMVFAVEPFYYNHDKNIAVFIEDDILITKTGAENLTNSLPRSPEDLEKMVGRR